MSELRQDPFTHDWIIIAKERAKRPHEFKMNHANKPFLPDYSKDCPFCPGNEHMTPEAVTFYGDEKNWQIRVVPNKFAALRPEGDTTREEMKFFRKMDAYGRHEVVIETPIHNEFIPLMDLSRIENLLSIYKERYRELKKNPNVRIILIFKNHGKGAGTSLQHPHMQIVAAPIVPPLIRRKYEVATQYYDDVGHCLYCDILFEEVKASTRIVMETDLFVALHPFSSHYPFETWIMPKIHKSSFGDISENEIKDLSIILKEILLKLSISLGNPDYNFIIHTAPVDDEHKFYYLWHIQIIPRLTQVAGFELGSGIYINIALPEETAAFMRDFKV
jgi:UDPglucose--hexose-1-phosphate uridylyltransferase